MNELIKITDQNGKRAVSARELHSFLESKQDFSTWIKNRIDKYDLVENVDFVTAPQIYGTANGGHSTRIEYVLTIDAAKELSMVEGNEKGKQARRYFLACEKKLKNGGYQIPQSYSEALMMAAKQQQQIEAQQKQITAMSTEIVEMKKKTDYLDIILSSKGTVTITQIAQDYGFSAKAFNKILAEKGIQRKVNGQWILYAPYMSKGYVHSKSINITHKDGRPDVAMNTEWTQRGRLFLYDTLKRDGIIPSIERNTNVN